MATINPNIALSLQPMEFESPLNTYAKFAQIQQAQQANELAKMQAQEYRRGLQEQEQVRNYLSGASDLTAPETLKGLYGFGRTGAEMAQKVMAARKEEREAAKSQEELISKIQSRYLNGIGSAKSFKELADVHQAMFNDPVLGPSLTSTGRNVDPGLKAIQQAQNSQDPTTAFRNLQLEMANGVEKYLQMSKPTVMQQGNRLVSVEPISGRVSVVPGSEYQPSITPYQRTQLALQALNQDPYNLTGAQEVVGMTPPENNAPSIGSRLPSNTGSKEPFVQGTGKIQPNKISVQQAFQSNLTGDEFINTLPAQLKEQVRSIIEHRLAPPTQNTKHGQQIMQLVSQADPTFDAKEYKTQSGYMTALTSGHLGKTLLATNTSIDHLATLEKAAIALDNKDTRTLNTIQNYFNKEFGGTKVTDFDAVKKIVGDEVNKAVIGGVGALADRQEIANTLSNASSMAQLAGVVGKLKELMAGRVRAMATQYKGVVNKDDFYERFTPPEVRKVLGVGQTSSAPKAKFLGFE